MAPLVVDTYDCVYLRPQPASTYYYPLGMTWKYVVSSKSTGCFGTTKKYTLTPETYYYPYYYYYVYYTPAESSIVCSSNKKVIKDKKKKKDEDKKELKDESSKEGSEKEEELKKSSGKKKYEYVEGERVVRTYVPVVEPYYCTRSYYVPRAILFP
ncbi:Uncharacterized protein PCOAH_00027170 [Plasmodium coatneyi]|uniref:Sporozoite surface protein essential for liver stage development n=1 Tax=Plasmodium coatneyi TaxID=208452 RepID=A0A1B1DZT3_9APIC|nr:Uncharacterized protein PCOAH_00027170 [Plasmodium coatneyi]ANQ08296.1 Uncharacterized protein PCOAH_00027170 [Plasmodium coatneyi]